MKRCSGCKEWKELTCYHRCCTAPDGFQYLCKGCTKISAQQRHSKNPEKRAARYKDWLSKNAEKKRASRAAYNLNNAAKNAAYTVEYRKKNRLKYNASMRRQRQANPFLRLRNNLDCRLWSALRRQASKNTKLDGATTLIGCTLDYLREHLESQFTEGMTWDNHGKNGWHIDHKKPCASFDMSDPAQQRECFHWKNLQPLWAFDNYKKGSKPQPVLF